MAGAPFWSPHSTEGVQASATASPCSSAPKRVLSLLLKIQPWGNAKSARLRAILGLAGPYTAPFALPAQGAGGQPQAQEAWLVNDDLNGDGSVVLEVTDGDELPQRKASVASAAPTSVRASCRVSTPSGCSLSDDGGAGGSNDEASELGTESNPLRALTPENAEQPGNHGSPATTAAARGVGPAVAALAEVTARRRRRKQEEAAAAGATALSPEGSAASVPATIRGRSNSKRQITVQRDPLHPNWMLGNRRVAMLGSNNRAWLPLHVLAQAQTQAQAQAQAQLTLSSVSPRSSGCETGADGSGAATAPSSPLLSELQLQQQQIQVSGPGALPSSMFQLGAGTAAAGYGGGGGPNSRASSTHSDRMLRSVASGLSSVSVLPRTDSLTGSSPLASFTSVQHPTQSTFLTHERDCDRDRELGPMQGLLRGSRMQGHVTAVTNPAYFAAAAAASAAIAAAVGSASSLAAVSAATSGVATGSGPPAGAPSALLREHSRRPWLLSQQPSADLEASLPVVAAVSDVSAAGRMLLVPSPILSPSNFATGGGGGGGGGGALRPSLAQQRDPVATSTVVAAATVPPRAAAPTAVVAAGLQGHAVTLRSGSPYQSNYHMHACHQNHGPYGGQQAPGSIPMDSPSLSQMAVHAQTVATVAGGGLGGSSPGPPPMLLAPATLAVSSTAVTAAAGASSSPAAVVTSVLWPSNFSPHVVVVQHQVRGGGNSSSSQQQQQQEAQQQQHAQARSGGLQQRRPSMTGFGSVRAQVQHRSTDGWTPLLPDPASGGGGVAGRTRDHPVSASAPHLGGTWGAAAAGAASDAHTSVADGGCAGAIGSLRGPSPPPLHQQPIPPEFSTASVPCMVPTPSAVAGPSAGQSAALPARPTSSAAGARPGSTSSGLGGSNGGTGLGGTTGSSTAWLSGGVSLLQALASGSESSGHHHHHHHHHNHHHNHHAGHQRPPRAPLPGGGVPVVSAASGGGGGGGGITSFLSMAPGRGSGMHRSYGRGGRMP